MRSTPIKCGSVVRSLRGRDEGRRFLVIKEQDENFVLVADGRLRTLDRLKLKRRKHLAWLGECTEYTEKISAGTAVENHEVRKWLFDEEE